MKSFERSLSIIILIVILYPISAFTEPISVNSFQNIEWQKDLTGEINFNVGPWSSYSFCVNRTVNMPVPQVYTIIRETIDPNSDRMRAAWLEENYAYSAHGQIIYNGTTYTAEQTGTAVQLAIWSVLGQGIDRKDPQYAGYQSLFDLRDYLINNTPAVSALQTRCFKTATWCFRLIIKGPAQYPNPF